MRADCQDGRTLTGEKRSMSLAGRKRRQSLRPICEINMTAFLSIQVALLAMFMGPAISFPDLPRGPSTDLAKVAHPVAMRAANREDAMVVAVMRTGDVYFLGDKTVLEQLDFRIRKQSALGSEKKVTSTRTRAPSTAWCARCLRRCSSRAWRRSRFLSINGNRLTRNHSWIHVRLPG
jgi:biopolymer transport protein ExbD